MNIRKARAILAVAAACVSFAAAQTQKQLPDLRLGIFADADSLPFLLCESDSLFAGEGVSVELVRFQSAIERESAFQSGVLDGAITDIPAVALAAQGGFQAKIASLTDGRYGIVAAPGSKAEKLADLADRPIGISLNTVIHYMVDTFMRDAGVPPAHISVMPVPKMPVRLEAVLSGQIEAAGMPEPFLTVARMRGARLLAATDDRGLGAGVLAFSAKALAEKREMITKLYKAYWKAAQRINADQDSFRSLLVEKAGFPEEASKAYRFVEYKKPRLPSIGDVRSALDWLTAKGLLKSAIDPASLLDGRPISGW